MKKQFSSVITMVLLFVATMAYAQAPQGFNYQAVIRDGSGNLITTGTVNIRFTVLQGSSSGTSVYQETQSVTPNSYGLVSLVVGSGNVVSGTFAGIGWGTSSYYLKVEADPTGGTSFVALGTPSQFQSVPYALNAGNGNWATNGTSIYNTNTGNVGIGTNSPYGVFDAEGVSSAFHTYDFGGTGSTLAGEFHGNSAGALVRYSDGANNYMDIGVDNSGNLNINQGSTGSTVFYIDQANGNVGIGTITPNYALEVVSSTEYAIWGTTTEANGNGVSGEADNGTLSYGVYGGSSSGYAGYFGGNVTVTGTFTNASDGRLKENVQPLSNAIGKLMQLAPSSYTFKKEYSKMNLAKGTQFGFIAQDLEKVFPELVTTNYDKQLNKGSVFEYKGVNYIGMVPVLTEAIKEQQQQIQDQQKQIDELKAMVQKLTTK
jgi:hypothetical protein